MVRFLFLSISLFVLVITCQAQSTETWIPSKILGIVYPNLARRSKVEGDVRAKCLIKEDGSVSDIEILSSPHIFLTDSVRSNLLQWKFRYGGSGTQENIVIVTYTFRLSGTCEDVRLCKETEFWYEHPYHVIAVADQFPVRY